ncbi:MAG: glycosyltransferase family 2 protein [Bacteroides sp.]
MQLSVVIVNYNVKYFVEQCLASVLKATEGLATEIFVVDNASSDESLEYLSPRFSTVHFIANKENIGFSRANNIAISQSIGEYVLLLNPDTILGENTLKDCLRQMQQYPNTGGIGVKMLGTDGSFALESRRGFPSPMTSFYKMSGLCSLFPYSRRFGKYYLRFLDEKEVNRIDVISGAFMFLRRSALDKSGLLDETFFMYGEDIDLSYRIKLSGYENYYLPFSPILHYKGESTKKDSFKYVYVFYDAMIIFFKKHFPHYSVFFVFAVKMVVGFRAFISLLVGLYIRLKKIIGFNKTPKFRFIVLGSIDSLNKMRTLCEQNKLNGIHYFVEADEQSLPDGHLKLDLSFNEFTHVVYDTDAYSYADILRLIEKSHQMAHLDLGTYSPQSKVLIIPQHNYCL